MKKNFLKKVINHFNDTIIPITKKSVLSGNKIFSAFIIKKSNLSLVVSGTNNEIENPLWHGEISAIKNFYQLSKNKRPNTKDCYFISSHEPCSLCLSAITWCGFNNFYYLFPYNETNEDFKIPHDLKILKEIFNISNGKYNTNNFYWTSYNLNKLINKLPKNEQKEMKVNFNNIKFEYKNLSNKYQLNKKNNKIPLK